MNNLSYKELIHLVWAIEGFRSMAEIKAKLQAEIDKRDGENVDENNA